MNTITSAITLQKRGRPLGSKNSMTIDEHNQRQIDRKISMKTNFQKYKAQHHEELKQTYLDHYYNNREKKLGRMNELYRLKSHIKQLMKFDVSILA